MPRVQISCPAAETSVVTSLRDVLEHALFSPASSAFLQTHSPLSVLPQISVGMSMAHTREGGGARGLDVRVRVVC